MAVDSGIGVAAEAAGKVAVGEVAVGKVAAGTVAGSQQDGVTGTADFMCLGISVGSLAECFD